VTVVDEYVSVFALICTEFQDLFLPIKQKRRRMNIRSSVGLVDSNPTLATQKVLTEIGVAYYVALSMIRLAIGSTRLYWMEIAGVQWRLATRI
jgi:hypothetical protein